MLRLLWAVLVLGLIAVTALGFLGPWSGLNPAIGDAFAVVRLPASAALALLLLPALRRPWLVLPGLSLAALGLVSALVPYSKIGVPGPVVLYQKNLSFRLTDPSALIADIRATAPDIITLQEVTDPHRRALLTALAADYPTQAFCPFAAVGGTAIFARWPAAGPAFCPASSGATFQPLTLPQGRVTAVSLHLHWPWPYGQAPQLAALLPDLAALKTPVLLGGDFNMVPWGRPVTAVMQATRSERAAPPIASFHIEGLVPIAIDHVLAPAGGQIERRAKLGSDHHGLLARLGL